MVLEVRRMRQVLLHKLHCLETHKSDGHICYTVRIGEQLLAHVSLFHRRCRRKREC